MATYVCPWCAKKVKPLATAEHKHEAVFVYSDPKKDPRAIARNPAMCPECFGVGGWEDFQVE